VTLRTAALRREGGQVEVVLRSGATAFQRDHFRAVARPAAPGEREPNQAVPPDASEPLLPLDPARDLYGDLLFQGGAFRRLRGYRRLHARECLAVVEADGTAGRFG